MVFILAMDEREKSDRGVVFAATLLQIITAPFIVITAIAIIVLFFVPFILTTKAFTSSMEVEEAFFIYAICFIVFVLSYVFSNVMMMMADTMKATHLLTENRKTPKSLLYDLLNNLFSLIALELIIGGMMGGFSAFALHDTLQRKFNLTEVLLFLAIIISMGFGCIYLRKLIMNLSWWSEGEIKTAESE